MNGRLPSPRLILRPSLIGAKIHPMSADPAFVEPRNDHC